MFEFFTIEACRYFRGMVPNPTFVCMDEFDVTDDHAEATGEKGIPSLARRGNASGQKIGISSVDHITAAVSVNIAGDRNTMFIVSGNPVTNRDGTINWFS